MSGQEVCTVSLDLGRWEEKRREGRGDGKGEKGKRREGKGGNSGEGGEGRYIRGEGDTRGVVTRDEQTESTDPKLLS